MEPIQEAIKSVAKRASEKSGIHPARHLERLLSSEPLRRFCDENPGVERSALIRSLNRLDQFVREWEHCGDCPGLARCPNMVPGHQPYLTPYAGYVDLRVEPCPLKRQADAERDRKNNIRSHYIPENVITMTFETLDVDASREEAIFAAMRFAAEYTPGEKRKGLYFYGDFGVGKSCIAGAMAQELAQRGISVYMVYTPEFFRELKEAIQQGSSGEKVEELKTVDVLVLDDIGAEMISPWVRDEVLGSILQYRVSRNLPTVFTSNLTYDGLEEHLAYSQRSGFEALKAGRIMERIRYETEAYRVGGPNRRRQRDDS